MLKRFHLAWKKLKPRVRKYIEPFLCIRVQRMHYLLCLMS